MIVLKQVTKYHGQAKILADVSFAPSPDEPIVVLGPSGSGKTTLLRLIAGLDLPDSGAIYMGGRMVSRPGWGVPPFKRSIGFVFQSSALWPHMTVAQNILFGVNGTASGDGRARLLGLLEDMQLSRLGGRYPDELSGGEARRVAIARCLAPRPKYLLMDEPLTNLDPDLKESVLSAILEAAYRTEALLVYVTHDTDEARRVSRHVLVMNSGKLQPVDTGRS